MKHIILFLLLATCSVSAFGQFPLGSRERDIRAYFDKHIAYASATHFKTKDRISAMRFRKAKGIGDYTFYFDSNGYCCSCIETYSNNELDNVVSHLNSAYNPVDAATWESDNEDTSITIVPARGTENYFRVVYLRSAGQTPPVIALASN